MLTDAGLTVSLVCGAVNPWGTPVPTGTVTSAVPSDARTVNAPVRAVSVLPAAKLMEPAVLVTPKLPLPV